MLKRAPQRGIFSRGKDIKEGRGTFKGIFVVNVKRNVDYNKLRTTAPKRGLLITGILPDPELGVAVFEWAATPVFFYQSNNHKSHGEGEVKKRELGRGVLCLSRFFRF